MALLIGLAPTDGDLEAVLGFLDVAKPGRVQKVLHRPRRAPRHHKRQFADCTSGRNTPRAGTRAAAEAPQRRPRNHPIWQRIFGLALGYEDLVDHDELRKDPTLAVLAGKLEPVLRSDCEALAGKSTLNRLEHTPNRHGMKFHKIDCDGAKVDALLVNLFVEAHERRRARS